MWPLASSAANKLPELSKAIPKGVNPETKVLCPPAGVISLILPLSAFPTNRFCACARQASTRTAPAQMVPPIVWHAARMLDLSLALAVLRAVLVSSEWEALSQGTRNPPAQRLCATFSGLWQELFILFVRVGSDL